MKGYHEGKRMSKVLMGVVSMVLCVMIVALSTMTAFAGSAVDATDGNILVFNSVDDIATDQICLIVFEDLKQTGADSEGRALIGGDLIIDMGWSASVKSKFQNDFALIVGGDIDATGYLSVGGCLALTADATFTHSGWDTQGNCQHCNTDCVQCTTCWAKVGKNIESSDCSMHHQSHQHPHTDTTGWIDAYMNAAETAFTAASAQYAARPNDGNVQINGSTATLSPAADHASGNPHVYHIDGDAITAVNFSGEFGGDSILINVSGKNPTCYSAQDSETYLQAHAVWNYYEATDLSISSNSVQGSLLAPYATFTGSNGHVNGTTIVKNMVGAGGFEYHTGNFFKDPLKAALSVTKKISDGSTPDDDFGFALYHQNGSDWELVDEFTLKAGESRNFADLPEGNTYKVVEVDSGAYELLTVTGGEVNSVSDRSAIFTVSSLVYAMVFTNEATTGSITVNKDLVDSIDPNAQFSFKVQKNNNGAWEDVTGGTFTLGDNGSYTVSGLQYGQYRVVESVDGAIYYTTVNGAQTATPEVTVSADDPNPQVSFTNERKTAVLTVNKTIKSGDNDNGEAFTFQLYKEENGAWVAEGEQFSLNANGSKQFTLPVGVNYKVEEISSGASYQLESSSNTEVYLTGDATASFVNAITRTGITVLKQVEGKGANAEDVFTFTITGPELDEEFTLKAGESRSFTGLQPGDNYVITETGMDSKYEFVSVNGGTADGQSTTLTVADGASAVFTNKVKTGSITVTKNLVDSVAPNAEFTFVIYDENRGIVDTITLVNGESKTISDLPYGSSYYISEQLDGKSYTTVHAIDSGADKGGLTAGPVTVAGDHNVVFTNTRASALIKVTKTLAAGALDLNETFTFQLYKKVDGSWVPQGGAVSIAAGATQTFTADVGAEYAVVETSSGNSYTLDTVAGGTETVSIGGAAGTAFVVEGETELVFTNKLKTGSIFVYKKLNDQIFTDSSFTFTLQRNNGAGWTDVEMIAIKNEQGYEFKNLELGYEYRIVETVDAESYTTSYKVEEAELDNNALTTGKTIVSGISGTTEGFVLDSAAKAVTFTNTRNTASLTIKKALASGSSNLGETFTFSIERLVNGQWIDTGRTVSLLAGSSEIVSGLEVGVTYRIIETSSGESYTYSSISGAESIADKNGGTITLNGDASVTVTNAIKTGKIVVTKNLVDNTDPDAEFTFVVYQLVNNEWTQYGQSFQLGNGESAEISGLPYGGIFKIREYTNNNYTTTYQIAGSTIEAAETSEIVISKNETAVEFTNTRKLANLTVAKKLTEGSVDFGEKFSFVLQRQDDAQWVDVESFKLANNETANFELAVGATYRVIEVDTGANYNFDSVEGGTYIATRYDGNAVNGASFTVSGDAAITVVNTPKPSGITIRKSVIGTNYGDSFTFDIQKFNGSDYETVQTISLKSGEYKTVDVLLGEQYRIVETKLDAKYELTSINGADSSKIDELYAIVTVDGPEDITFANTVKTGSITVNKTLNDNLDTDATFVFEAYKQIAGEWVLMASKTMGANGTWVIEGVEYGSVIKVVEADANGARYETVNTVGGTTEAVITVDGDETIGFTNTRKTASLEVTKALTEGTNNIGGAFLFELMVEKDGSWASVTGFRLEAGETKTIENLNADATYMLIEKLDDDAMYVLDTFTGGTRVTYNGYDAVKFTAVADTVSKVTAFNANAETTLTIDKTVTGEYDNEVFEFTVEQKVGDTYVPVQSFKLANGQSKSFVVSYGDEYRITETINSANYKLTGIEGADSNNGTVAVIAIDNAAEKVSYTNARKSTSIEVGKKLADGANDIGGTFAFALYEKNANGAWKLVKEFELAAGKTETISDLVAGKDYLVIEKIAADSQYKFSSVTGGTQTAFDGSNGAIVTAVADTTSKVTFENTNAATTLTVGKTVTGEYDNQGFTFLLEKKVGEGYEAVQTFTLTKDATKTFTVNYGDEYRITETVTGANYSFTKVTGADSNENEVAYIAIDSASETVTYTNARKAASLNVAKALAAGSNDLGEEFTFEVYRKDGSVWKTVKTLTIKAGETAEVTGLVAGAEYLVVEKIASNSAYSFLSVSGNGVSAAVMDGKNGGFLTAEPDADNTITFTNKIKGASLTLNKVVEGDAKNDVFTFELKINGKTETVTVTPGTPYTRDLSVGDKVVITETTMADRFELLNVVVDGEVVKGETASLTIGNSGNNVTFTNGIKEASLTVTKALAEGSTELDGDFEFKFDVYHVVNGAAVKMDSKSFVLDGIGDSYTVTGLLAGETYMVVETESGVGYVCAENEKTITLVDGKNNLTIENENDKTTVEVHKVVDGIYRGEDFEFTYSVNGGEEVSFQLGDGEFKVIDVHYGDTVVINEADDGEYYELKGIEGATNADGTEATVVVTVGGQKVIYTNTNTTAKLTINKALAVSNTDIGGEFTFDVYHVGEKTETLVASGIKLGLGGSHTVEGLISGETYKVVETETGEGYVCVANNKTATLEPGKNNSVTIENKNASAVVTIRKFVDAKYQPADAETFEFTVVVNGEALENVVLKAGAEYQLAVNYGDVVEIEEIKLNGRYVLAGIEGADTAEGAKATVTVDSKNETVTYTNKVKTGSITVHKDVIEEVASGNTFTFKLQRLNENGEYVDCGKSLELGNGEYGTFDNLEYGEYMVVEISDPDYTTQYKLGADDDATSGNAAAKKVNGDDSDIYFINKRGTVQVTITKDLLNGASTSEKFTFLVQRADENGKWVDIKTVTIAGEGTSEPIELDVKTTYRVIETSTGASYVYSNAYADAVLNGQTDTDAELGSGIKFVPEGSGNITFVNELKTTSVKVMKVLSSGNATDEFTFVYTINDGAAVTKTIKGGETFSIDGVKYTDVVKVYEKSNSDYELESITSGGVTVKAADMLVSGSDLGVAHKVDADNEIIFTNTIRQGSLTVTKTVVDEYAADSNAVFTFKAEKLVGGTWTEMDIITLKNGESYTFKGLDYSTLVRVTEMDVNKNVYQTVYSVNDSIAVAGIDDGSNIVTDYIRISGDDNVEFVNTRKSANLAITKSVGTGADLGETFTVVVSKRSANGWTKWAEVELAAGETKTVEVGVGVEYKIEETKTGASYKFSTIDGADYDGSTYTININESGTTKNVTVINEIKTGKIIVSKILADAVTPGATFTVTADITTADGRTYTETGTISAEGRATFTDIPYGSSVVITESVDGSSYTTVYEIDGIDSAIGTPVVVNAETTNVSFTNTRLQASITVSKALAAGDEDLGENFKFQLYKSNDGVTFEAVGKVFTLAAGASTTIDGLDVGATYRIVEIATGEHYTFDTVNGDGKLVVTENGAGAELVLTKDGAEVEFVNTVVRGGIRITKILGRGEENNDVFHFEITRRGSNTKLYVAPNGDGTYAITESGDVTGFDLKAGESIHFTGLVSGYDYIFTETGMGDKYEFAAISGDGAINGQSITVTVPEGDVIAEATFTNNVKVGALTVSKTVVDAADPNAEFTFSLQHLVTSGSDVAWQPVTDDVTLKNGQSATFNGLLYGDTYRVVETVDGRYYTTSYTVDGAASNGTVANVTIGKADTAVNFTNVRKSSEVTLTKTVGGYMADNEEFYINVSGIFEDGQKTLTYVVTKTGEPVGARNDSVIYIAVGQTVTVPGTLYGETYTVQEIGSTYYTTTINGETVLVKDILVEGKASIYVDNQRNTATLKVSKTINEADKNYGDEFTFQLYVENNGAWEAYGEAFTLVGGQTVDITGLYTGRNYKVVETATGANYSFFAVNSDNVNDVKLTSENGIKFLLSGDKNVNFINKANTQGLIVRKAVENGGKAGETFAFQLYTKEGNDWVAYGEQFYLKAGEYAEFPALPVGDTYKIVEVDTGYAYNFKSAAVNGSASYTINEAEKAVEVKLGDSTTDVTFTNAPKKAAIAVTKSIVSGSDLGEEFTVVVSRRDGDSWVEIDNLTLNGGETKTIEVAVGVEYRIVETSTGNSYNFGSITGDNVVGNVVTVNAAGTTAYVNVNNIIKTGSVVVSKVLNDNVDPNKTFTVTANITTADGQTWTETGTISATGNATFTGIPYGATVTVIETVDKSIYSTTCTIDGKAAENGTPIVIGAPSTAVQFTNTRLTADITVSKTLAGGDEDLGETFTFQLYKKEAGQWVAVGNVISLNAGSQTTIDDLAVGVEYRVIEIGTGEHYSFKSVTGGNLVATEDGSGAEFTLEKNGANIRFTNEVVRGGFRISKAIGNFAANNTDTFHFEITRAGSNKNLYVADNGDGTYGIVETGTTTGFDLKANESIVFTGLVAGYEYIITETGMDDKYEFASITGEGFVNGQSITMTVPAGAEQAAATFTNNVKNVSLTVGKTVVDAAAPNATFNFKVERKVGSDWQLVQIDGKDTVTLGNGQTATYTGLFYGETYRVTETVDGTVYSTTYSVAGAKAVDGTSAEVTVTRDTSVNFTNTRKNSEVTLTKTVGGYMADNEEFFITVSGIFEDGEKTLTYIVTKDGKPVAGSTAEGIRIAVGEEVTVPGTLYGQNYTVKEIGSAYYSTTINGETTVEKDILVNGKAQILVDNQRTTASITVGKIIRDGDANYGDQFTFELYVQNGSNWELVDSLSIVGGDTGKFTGLYTGRNYKVVEADTGKNYSFFAVTADGNYEAVDNGAVILLENDRTVTFTNSANTRNLTVVKTVTAGGKAGETFTFQLFVKNGSTWNKYGEAFNLKAGESKEFTGLPVGDEYKIAEISTGDHYDFDSITVENAANFTLVENEQAAQIKLGESNAVVTFNNTPKTAQLTVEKTINGTSTDEAFNFQLFVRENTGWVLVDSFKLAAGETKAFDVISGIEYKVVESAAASNYKLVNVTGADDFNLTDGSATVTISGDEKVVYTNEIKVGAIVLTKTVTGFAPNGDEFEFTVLYSDGTAVKSDALSNGKVVLENGDKVIISGIEYGKTVVITEKVDTNYYTATYTVDSEYGEGAVADGIVIDSDITKVDFFNKYEEPVVLNAYSNGQYKDQGTASVDRDTVVEDVPPQTTTSATTTTTTTKATTTTATTTTTTAADPNTTTTTGNGTTTTQQTTTTTTARPTTTTTTTTRATTTTPPTTTTTKRNTTVLGASEINSVSTYINSTPSPDGEQIITKVLGDSDTPDTGDEIPVSVVIALAVSTVMVLTLGKKKRSAAF